MLEEGDLPLRGQRDVITPGEDITGFSVDDLKTRIEMLHSEVARAEAMIRSKTAGREAAESVFRKS